MVASGEACRAVLVWVLGWCWWPAKVFAECVYGDGVAINLCCENGGKNVLAIVVEIAGRVDRRIYSTPTIDHEFRFTGTIPSSMH